MPFAFHEHTRLSIIRHLQFEHLLSHPFYFEIISLSITPASNGPNLLPPTPASTSPIQKTLIALSPRIQAHKPRAAAPMNPQLPAPSTTALNPNTFLRAGTLPGSSKYSIPTPTATTVSQPQTTLQFTTSITRISNPKRPM
jgi:hypothetical protein